MECSVHILRCPCTILSSLFCFQRHGQSNGVTDKSVEPSDNLESVDSDNAGQNLNQIKVKEVQQDPTIQEHQ